MVFNAEEYKQYDQFVVELIEKGFPHVQINRPRALNAFAETTWRQYSAILLKLDQDPDTKVILISSTNDRSFSSGLDVKAAVTELGEKASIKDPKKRIGLQYEHIQDFQKCIGVPAEINTPTIVLVNGICYGLGLDIIAACTIRVATLDAKFSIKEIDIGIPADIGSLQRLPSLVNNKSLLNELALTADNFYCYDALKLGLISRIVETREAGLKKCVELGKKINSKQQWAIRGTKASIQFMNDGGEVKNGLQNIAVYNAHNINEGFAKNLKRIFKM